MHRIVEIARKSLAPEPVRQALEGVSECVPSRLDDYPDSFLLDLGQLLIVSPPMLDTVRAHPEYLSWLRDRSSDEGEMRSGPAAFRQRCEAWNDAIEGQSDFFDSLRVFKRREYLLLSFMDVASRLSFQDIVHRLSELADWVIQTALQHTWKKLAEEESARPASFIPESGFAVIAMGKLGGMELNYSSDVDLIFCRRNPENAREQDFFLKLGERLVGVLSKIGPEGFLYRIDMRLRPHGATGPLAPTIDSLVSYYESWGEPWERQALIKARFIAGSPEVGRRIQDFVAAFTFSRQLDESALEDVKRIKHRAEKEFSVEPKIHLKQGPGGIRDIEFYVQFSQLTIGWKYPEVCESNTLKAIEALARTKVLLEGEESALSLAYIFLRTVEHRLQLKALTPQAVLPDSSAELSLLASALGYGSEDGNARDDFLRDLNRHRVRVRGILERVYLAPGYLRLHEREEELAQLLSDRAPRRRVHELLSQYGFRDIDKAWQNIRLLALGPEGRLLPPGERRSFLEFAFPMLEVLKETIDPDRALHNLEDFATATGNRISFLRTLASRRPHLLRLTNLLALSNRCRQILSRHPEYFDSLARGIFLHEGRDEDSMHAELRERMGVSPRGEARENVLRKYRQRETVRIAYRDLAGLADSLEISRELSDLASACLLSAMNWTRTPYTDPSEDRKDPMCLIALGKLGSQQMHYASDLDLIFLYDAEPEGTSPQARSCIQKEQDERVEKILELLAGVTPEGVVYSVDLRLRPEGASGILARSWESFLEYSRKRMQPWERMALVRSRMLTKTRGLQQRWDALISEIVYEYDWNSEAVESIRHLKRRIETEKNRETRHTLDFKYGKGGIADLEFLVQFLQTQHGRRHPNVRAAGLNDALLALRNEGILDDSEADILLRAHKFERLVENRYQLMEEWTSREVSREAPALARLAGSIGYGRQEAAARKSFISDWDNTARSVRALVEKYFYSKQ